MLASPGKGSLKQAVDTNLAVLTFNVTYNVTNESSSQENSVMRKI